LDQSLALDPGNGNALVDKGRLRIDAGQWQEARQPLQRVPAGHPAKDEARLLSAVAALRGPDVQTALAELEALVLLRPDYAKALYELALVYQKLNRTADANRALERFRKTSGVKPPRG
jgi:Tfp pilus assembly protein PilF